MTTLYVILTGFFIRFGIPLLLMIALVHLLRRLDARWQNEAIAQQRLAEAGGQLHPLDLKECTIDDIAGKLSIQSAEPCWQVFRKSNGYLQEECLNCKVFRASPILMLNN